MIRHQYFKNVNMKKRGKKGGKKGEVYYLFWNYCTLLHEIEYYRCYNKTCRNYEH